MVTRMLTVPCLKGHKVTQWSALNIDVENIPVEFETEPRIP